MLTHAKESKATEFIVATETGIIHQLQNKTQKRNFSLCEKIWSANI